MVLSCHKISKAYGTDEIIKDVSFQIEQGEKAAIIGNNGAGKSTLLKIITGEITPDDGEVVTAKDTVMGYLAQYQGQDEEGTMLDIVLSAREDLIKEEASIREMEARMEQIPQGELDAFMERYHSQIRHFDQAGGYTFRSEAAGILKGLGFSESDFSKTMDMLSGGQKTRVSLAKLLVLQPDILLLDEPINHLDLSSIQWLEDFLQGYRGAVLIVAHDRYFLDRIVTKVIDISFHRAKVYRGNYTEYAAQRELERITLQNSYEKQQREIAHQQEVIDKLKSYNREKSVRRAESRQKMLDKMERLEPPQEENSRMQLELEPDVISGKDVLEVSDLAKSYDGRKLFEHLSFQIQRGDRIALLGDNGTGKTTILKIINGVVEADAGSIRLGANVSIGYYDQEQQNLSGEKTLFEEMQDAYPELNNTRIRNILAAFMFTGDDVFKRIDALSGGERGRISLAKLMLSGANFLILDEPTNHLDMESKDILEQALNRYTGTILYVSHDRYFVNRTASRILELSGGKLELFYGNYDYYMEKKRQAKETAVGETGEEKNGQGDGRMDWEAQKKLQAQKRKVAGELARTEKEIQKAEDEIASIEEEFQKEEVATNSAKLNELTARQNELQEQLEDLYLRWEELSESPLLAE